MSELKSYGYLKLKAGNRYRGYEYIITDYNEYKSLRQSIERRFEAILQNVRKISNPVAQSSPPHKVGYLNVNESIN
jgi:excinuclease UvrABC nuclease subunit